MFIDNRLFSEEIISLNQLHKYHLEYIHLALLVCLILKLISDCEGSEIRLYHEVVYNSISSCKNTTRTSFFQAKYDRRKQLICSNYMT